MQSVSHRKVSLLKLADQSLSFFSKEKSNEDAQSLKQLVLLGPSTGTSLSASKHMHNVQQQLIGKSQLAMQNVHTDPFQSGHIGGLLSQQMC